MPRGDKSSYTSKQKRQASHIEQGYEESGIPRDEAEARAWATVNKQDRGGRKSGSGRGKTKRSSEKRRGWHMAKRTTAKRAGAGRATRAKRATRGGKPSMAGRARG